LFALILGVVGFVRLYKEGIKLSIFNEKQHNEKVNGDVFDNPFREVEKKKKTFEEVSNQRQVEYSLLDDALYGFFRSLSVTLLNEKGGKEEESVNEWLKKLCEKCSLKGFFVPICTKNSLNYECISLDDLLVLLPRKLGSERVALCIQCLFNNPKVEDAHIEYLFECCERLYVKNAKGVGKLVMKIRALSRELTYLEADKSNKVVNDNFSACKQGPVATVFDIDLLEKAVASLERRSRQRDNIERILKQGDGTRRLAQVDKELKNKVESLKENFPNFTQAIEYYADQMSLSALTTNKVFSAMPLLLLGPPGVGKTAFINALAELIGVCFKPIDMSTMSAGFILTGNSYKWEGGSQGAVLESLRDGDFGNPFIFLDEIDKSAGDHRYDPCSALHLLLEEKPARKFIDESIDMPIDASKIIWVAAANHVEDISEPILSRFTVLNIELPKGDDMVKVIDSIWRSIIDENEWGASFNESLDLSVSEALKGEPARKVKKILRRTCGCIASKRELSAGMKHNVMVADLSFDEGDIEVSRPFGFIG